MSQEIQNQQAQAPQELNRYLDLPVTVISEPVGAIREEKQAEKRKARKCDWKVSIKPVVDGKKQLTGIKIPRNTLDMATLSDTDGSFPVEEADLLNEVCRDFPLLPDTAPVSQAQTLFELGHWQHLPLVDAQGRYTGQCACRKRLNQLLNGTARPVRIGGLATPFGVYMTSGLYTSGAGLKGLIATGIMFAVLANALDYWLLLVISALTAVFPGIATLPESLHLTLEITLVLCSFMMLIRLTPISGLHAAEHMTINAIENDLPILPTYIRSQPRAHPRCGTNLMVLLGGIELVGIFLHASWNAINPLGKALYTCIGLLLVFKFWQPIGLWLQQHFTTKDPTDAQLESGIKAGRELLEKYRALPHPYPSLWQRILGSGMIHMAVTFIFSAWLIGSLMDWWMAGPVH